MKKIIYVLFAMFTFSIGFYLFKARPLVTTVSLCEISGDAELYRAKKIYIKAFLDGSGLDETDRDWSVSDYRDGCLTGASLVVSDKLKTQLENDEELNAAISELRQKKNKLIKNREDGLFVIEVEITGEIERRPYSDYGGLVSPPPFIIRADQIKQISPIRFVSQEEIMQIIENSDKKLKK